MTTQDKKTRVERLKDEPLFFYSTLRASVEQLDSLKATFQYLLAAFESNMDPVTKAQYAQMKQIGRTESLEELGRKARAEAQAPTLGSISFADLEAQIAKTFPGLRTHASVEEPLPPQGQVIPIEQLQMGHQQIIPGSGTSDLPASNVMPLFRKSSMPTDVHPEQVPAGTRQRTRKLTTAQLMSIVPPLPITKIISITAGDLGESLYEVAEADLVTNADESVLPQKLTERLATWGANTVEPPNSPLAQTSTDTLLLDLKRAGARSLVAQEINKVLKENGIILTEAELLDYMENKISREDLARLAKRVSQEHAIEEPATQAVGASQSLIPSEFSLDQIGQLQSMVYGETGLLSRILAPNLHRYGKGTVVDYNGTLNLDWVRDDYNKMRIIGGSGLNDGLHSGIYVCLHNRPEQGGILVHLEGTEKYRHRYSVWLPLYQGDAASAPMIHATRDPRADFCILHAFNQEDISDITSRLLHYLVKWKVAITGLNIDHGHAKL